MQTNEHVYAHRFHLTHKKKTKQNDREKEKQPAK